VLVLDLDNTLIHSAKLGKNQAYDINDKDVIVITLFKISYAVKIRPYLELFIRGIAPLFEVYIFTMADYSYATRICSILKERCKQVIGDSTDIFSKERIISRE